MSSYWGVWDLIGQGAKTQARDDRDDYDPSNAEIERDGVERFFDNLTGRSAALQEEGRKQYVKNLKGSDYGKKVLSNRENYDITPTTTEQDLLTKIGQIKRRDPLISAINATGQNIGEGAIGLEALQKMSAPELQGILSTKRIDAENAAVRREYDNPINAAERDSRKQQQNFQQTLALSQLGLSEQRLADQREVNQMQNALQMRREDRADRGSERDRMMAMIAMMTQGLGNVGNILA